MRRLEQHYLLSQEHYARQPRYDIEANGPANTKTQERTEGAAKKAVKAMRGDSCNAEQMVQDGPKTSIIFGVEAGPPDLPCWEDVLVEERALRRPSRVSHPWRFAHHNSRRWLSSHRRILHSHGDHLQRATSSVLSDRGDESRGGLKDGKLTDFNSIRLVRQHSNFWRLLAAPYCRRVVETKSWQNRTFDPGGSRGHLRSGGFLPDIILLT